MTGEKIIFSGVEFTVKQLLGKGKSAYSWLCESGLEKIVLKQIHDEPCPYYAFSDKFEAEMEAYRKLWWMQMPAPEMLGYDEEKKWIFKEYIHGQEATRVIANDELKEDHFRQLFAMAKRAKDAGFNLDYFPANFIISCKTLYYIDYETNPYDDAWNLKNWGLYYWVNNEGMKKFLDTGDAGFINEDQQRGIPFKKQFTAKVNEIIRRHGNAV